MFLSSIVPAALMMMSSLPMMMGCCLMMSGSVVMVFTRWVFGAIALFSVNAQPLNFEERAFLDR
jgi:hypothetical protein